MKIKYILLTGILAAFFVLFAAFNGHTGKSVLDFEVRSILSDKYNPVRLSDYEQNVILIVNTPTECGHLDKYAKLNDLYIKYHDRGLVILAFPSGSFDFKTAAGTESGTFCPDNYRVAFPLLQKIDVNGPDIHPLYAFLTHSRTNPAFAGPVRNDFEKFLVSRGGEIIGRFAPDIEPDDPAVVRAIERAL